MRKVLLILYVLIGSRFSVVAHQQSAGFQTIAYYSGNGENLHEYSIDKLSQIIFSFFHLSGDTLENPSPKRLEALYKVVALKQKYPRLKVLISLGGWGGCASCSEVFSVAESRKRFAASVKNAMDKYQVDGIDLDWEYPAIPGFPGHTFVEADREHFTDLMVQIRAAIGTNGQLSFAAGGFTTFLEKSIDWKMVMPLVDRVNFMTYDLVHGFSTETGHHTPLYSTNRQVESTDNCVQWLLRNGIPPEKIVIGAAFYARVWEDVSRKDWGLYKPGKFRESIDYKNFEKLEPDSGWAHQWDEKALAPYAFHKTKNYFATYDNGMSLEEKVKYAYQNRLGGIMFWELNCDKPGDGLLEQLAASVLKFFSE